VLEFIEKYSIRLFNSINDFLVKFINFFVFLGNNQSSSLLKPIDDLSIVVSKGDLGNFNWMLWFTFFERFLVAKIRHSLDSLFQFSLDVQFELRNLVDWVSFVVIILLKVVEEIFVNIELNCVISSGDGLDIVVNELVDLYALDIVEVDDGPQINEDGDGSCSETVNLPHLHELFWDFTCILDEEIGLLIAFLGDVSICIFVHVFHGQLIKVAVILTLTLLSNVGIKPVLVEAISASLVFVIL